ncbi:hypothetical protein BH18ACT8_BH18ACT8_07810 [soil metagenome]
MCVAVLPSMVIFRSPMVFLLIMSKPQHTKTRCVSTPMSATPKSSWGWVKAMLHSIYDQPDAKSVHAQFDRVVKALAEKLPAVAEHLEKAHAGITAFTAFTAFPKEIGRQIWSNNPISNASTARSAAAPTSSGSFPTATPRSASSVQCSPSNTTTGPKVAATSDSTSSPAPGSP